MAGGVAVQQQDEEKFFKKCELQTGLGFLKDDELNS